MSAADPASPPGSDGERVSRRAAVLELAGIAVVLAVPAGAVLTTANPIPNPPSRKTLNFAPPANPGTEQRERAAEKENRRADKNKQKRDDRESLPAGLEEEQPSSVTE